MFLTALEIAELTGRRRRDAQIKALRSMGIEHRIRPDGHPVVSRSHIEKLLDGAMTATAKKEEFTLDLDRI